MLAIKTILFPTDFSKHAELALPFASALARDYGGRLLIAHVQTPPAVAYGEMDALPPDPVETEEVVKKRLLSIRPAGQGVPFEHYYIIGDPAGEIVRLANEKQADLIVMGTHGRRGLRRLLMGSVAEQVVRKAPCPVVTVKDPAHLTESDAAHAAK
jgi:nucleotide-binding universal stress UspA family protein